MKRIEDIENLSFDALEKMADNCEVSVPAGLEEGIRSAIIVKGECRKRSVKALLFPALTTLATAIACLIFFLSLPSEPEDTFNDPYQAYAQLEKTFSYISSTVDKSLKLTK